MPLSASQHSNEWRVICALKQLLETILKNLKNFSDPFEWLCVQDAWPWEIAPCMLQGRSNDGNMLDVAAKDGLATPWRIPCDYKLLKSNL